MRRAPSGQQGFTLIELLVVVAIIAILMALLLPAVQKVREAANRMSCGNNLKNIGIALHAFHHDHHAFPPGAISTTAGFPSLGVPAVPAGSPARLHGWVVFILPYLEQKGLYDQYRRDLDWRHPLNQPVVTTQLKIMQCPSAAANRIDSATTGGFTWRAACTDYGVINGVASNLATVGLIDVVGNYEGVMVINKMYRIADIMDGTSSTILIAEDAGRPQRFRAGQPLSGRVSGAGWADRDNEYILHGFTPDGVSAPGPCAINCTNDNEVYGFHPTGAQVLLGDGSVHLVRKTISIRVFARAITRQGNEMVSPEQF